MNGGHKGSNGSSPPFKDNNSSSRAHDLFPHEIKILIYQHVDLESLKTLRYASPSWASAGLQYLLLPTFNVRSTRDIHRLLAIGLSPNVSHQAAKTITRLSFQSQGWDPRYFRNIVCNRHELRQRYEPLDFVPTRAEQAALDELDEVIRQKDVDAMEEEDLDVLVSVFRHVPRVDGVSVLCENPFKHPILRKSWEEYDLEAYQLGRPQHAQLFRILGAAKDAGLVIKHLKHERLLSGFFQTTSAQQFAILHTIKNLRSLSLVVSDLSGSFNTGPWVGLSDGRLRDLISNSPHLTSLSITFEVLGTMPITFLDPRDNPSPSSPLVFPAYSLHELALSGVSMSNSFFTFLDSHRCTLKRLSLRHADLPPGTMSWREFLERLRDEYGSKLQKFQLSGMVRSRDNEEECWMLFPSYADNWEEVEPSARNRTTRALEDFVIRGTHWPMVASDNFWVS